ncbi:hypothetical protein [Epizootic haematopoietic necrosis virus]|uniref:Uncharacterized protein n=1 Tax=Epizootic haematopoietic necrosis virus TaxID=100217 RepID=D3TTT8_9VIRU|nr:hypothetical protein ATL82_gp055 [Epizootic haematopoietic necrosis virus]ACO25245.1 hypothetical protein [Epizootic haematopoietic necrosis virus]QNN79866.1 hypothetical protein [Epizootic haematopoietic necrosis virus]QNN79966.1 hypothetical protein [Epizootic haematopoietic necrosis virus]QNN80066.1 hypothetical protein [Epizootic haematopoietic necrosis virus]QNN80166.1 hypothetical protein [Epizootic haematopoietic necrosis virus]
MQTLVRWLVSRMVAYPGGGFLPPCNLLILKKEIEKVMFGGTKDSVFLVTDTSAIVPPQTKMVVIAAGIDSRKARAHLKAQLCSGMHSSWVVYDPDMRPSVSIGVYIRNVWTDGRYLPWLYQRDHVTDVVVYSQSDPEKYISFLQSIASAIEPKLGDVEELMFLPHMSYAKMAMSDIGSMAECLRSESVKDFKDHNKSVAELLGLMFGERPFGHLEMLSEQRAAYSCGEALRKELENLPRGEAVVAVRNAQYAAYVRTVVGGLAQVKTFTEVEKTWGAHKTVFLPMGISASYPQGKRLIAKMRETRVCRVVAFTPEDNEICELSKNKPYIATVSLWRAHSALAKVFRSRRSATV